MSLRNYLLGTFLIASCFALTACEKAEDKEARHLKQGNAYFEQGDYIKARLEYKNAAKVMPTDAEPRYRLGLIDEAEGDPRNAIGNFLIAEQQNAHYHPALLKLANYYLAVNAFDEADHRLNIVLAEKPEDAQGHALRAAILLRKKDFSGTEKEARRALATDPANITATAVLAGLYANQKEEDKAIATLDDSIKLNPKEISLLLLKVMIYEQSKKLDKVADAYKAIFELQPNNPTFRMDLAKVYAASEKPAEAEAILRQAIKDIPASWDIKHELVTFLGKKRGLESAESEVNVLMKANPENNELFFWLAELYLSHDATDRAVKLLEQMVGKEADANSGLNARTSLARIHFIKGDREIAEKLVAAVLQHDRGNQDALLIRAQLSFDAGRFQDAVSDLRTIIRDNPKAEDAYKLLAETLLVQGHLDLSIDTLNQLMTVNPANFSAIVRLAQMYALNDTPEKAIELLATVTKIEPDYTMAWEAKTRIAISIKDWKTAEESVAKLDALPKQHLTAQYLKGQILDLGGKRAEALPFYIEVMNADPASPLAEHAISSFVEAKLALNQLPDAVETIKKLKASSPFISTILGGCLVKLGNTDDAAVAFDLAIEQKSSSPDAYIARAEIYLQHQSLDEALGVLKKAQERIPSDIRAPMLSANILVKTNHYKEAIDIYAAILNQRPNTAEAANNMAQLIAEFQHDDPAALQKALQVAERFARSDNPIFLDTLGWVYFRMGKIEQAQVIMERVMASKDALPAELHYHYGKLLLQTGKKIEAKGELQKATEGNSSYPGIEEAKTLLKNL